MSRSRRKDLHIRVVGKRRKEPDVRRIAKAIIRLSLDNDETTDRLLDLEHEQRAIARRRHSPESEPPEQAAS